MTKCLLGLSRTINVIEITSYDVKSSDVFCYANTVFLKMNMMKMNCRWKEMLVVTLRSHSS